MIIQISRMTYTECYFLNLVHKIKLQLYYLILIIIYNINLTKNPSIGKNQKNIWFTECKWDWNIPGQHCTNYDQEQTRLHLVGPLDSTQKAMSQPTFNTGLAMDFHILCSKTQGRSPLQRFPLHGHHSGFDHDHPLPKAKYSHGCHQVWIDFSRCQ